MRFSPDIEYDELSWKDKITVNYCHRKLHQLPYYPTAVEGSDLPILRQRDVTAVLSTALQSLPPRRNANATIAFKGSVHEREMIENLGFDAVDLNDLAGCPKADDASKCHHLLHGERGRCAANVVWCYREWLMRPLNPPTEQTY